jgi:predicted  nucleic acid-binding Zn-ribbon protein|tara:strand:- start:1174 stop:1377 length:204 start_codon:yes stop_codon:yes gene_type:complete
MTLKLIETITRGNQVSTLYGKLSALQEAITTLQEQKREVELQLQNINSRPIRTQVEMPFPEQAQAGK